MKWFGQVPSFHDAEILDLHLKREGASTLKVHAWNMTSKVRNGYFVLGKHAVVEFTFEGITDLELEEFNHQNAIDGLTLSRSWFDENLEVFEVLLKPAYGLAGFIRAIELSVSHSPGKPEQALITNDFFVR